MSKKQPDRKATAGIRADKKARDTIAHFGWRLSLMPDATQDRFVAKKEIIEDDDSVTNLYESSYTLIDLSRRVKTREAERGNYEPRPPVRVREGVRK